MQYLNSFSSNTSRINLLTTNPQMSRRRSVRAAMLEMEASGQAPSRKPSIMLFNNAATASESPTVSLAAYAALASLNMPKKSYSGMRIDLLSGYFYFLIKIEKLIGLKTA